MHEAGGHFLRKKIGTGTPKIRTMSTNTSFSKVYFAIQSTIDSSYKLTTCMYGTQRILEYESTSGTIVRLVDGRFVELDIDINAYYIRFTAELNDGTFSHVKLGV